MHPIAIILLFFVLWPVPGIVVGELIMNPEDKVSKDMALVFWPIVLGAVLIDYYIKAWRFIIQFVIRRIRNV